MRAFFVRHGQSTGNTGVQNDLTGDGDALTDLGWQQANQLGKRLQSESISLILASPLQRAQETASAIASHIDVPIEYCPEAHEVVGNHLNPVQPKDEAEKHESYWQYWAGISADSAPHDGESFSEIDARVNKLLQTIEGKSDESILVVSHGDLLRFLLGKTVLREKFKPSEAINFIKIATRNTGISEFEKNDDGWRLVTWMDQSHL